MSLLSKLERANAKAMKVLILAETSKLNLLSLTFPKRTTSGPFATSSSMKFLMEGRSTLPLKFSMYPPISLIHTGWRFRSTRILSLFSGYSARTLKGISSSYTFTCGKSMQYLTSGFLMKSRNSRGLPIWNKLVMKTTVASSYRGYMFFYLALLGLGPGPNMFSTSPRTFDFILPRYCGPSSSKLLRVLDRMKVDVGLEPVFLALMTQWLSQEKWRWNQGQKVLNPSLSRMISILRVVFSRMSIESCLTSVIQLEKLQYSDPVMMFSSCWVVTVMGSSSESMNQLLSLF